MNNSPLNRIKSSQELDKLDIIRNKRKRLIQSNTIRRICRGTYAPTDLSLTLEEKHLANALGVKNRTASLVLCNTSAAIAWGIAVLNQPRRVHIRGTKGSRTPDVRVHQDTRTKTAPTAITPDGFEATTPIETVISCARFCPFLDAVVIADSALFRRVVTYSELYTELHNVQGIGASKARKVADSMCENVMSPGETLLRLALIEYGLSPIVQCPVQTATRTYHGDLGLPEQYIIFEFDGKVKYSGAYGGPQRVLLEEKQRMDDIVNAGWRVIRISWDMLRSDTRQLEYILKQNHLI